MEVQPGVFRSSTGTTEWEPDEEIPGSDVHVLVDADGVQVGMSRMTQPVAPIVYTPDRRETLVVLEGSVRIELASGTTLELGAGGMASIPAGVETTWHLSVPFKEIWFFG